MGIVHPHLFIKGGGERLTKILASGLEKAGDTVSLTLINGFDAQKSGSIVARGISMHMHKFMPNPYFTRKTYSCTVSSGPTKGSGI